jgi:lysophospholipase L1-like esterase
VNRRTAAVAFAAAIFVLLVVATEMTLRWVRPLDDPYATRKATPSLYVPSQFAPNLRLRVNPEPGLPGVPATPGRFTTNNLGFRGDSLAMPKPANELRIFMVGGSTTECLFLTDSLAVSHRLQERLAAIAGPAVAVRVYNAGKSGDKTIDHVAMVAHRIAHLDPDLVIIFAGFNDLFAAVSDIDYLVRRPHRDESWTAGRLLTSLATELQLGRLAWSAFHGAGLTGVNHQRISLTSNYRDLARAGRDLPVTDQAPRTDVASYRENLLTLAGIAEAHGFELLLMTQASTWNSSVDPEARNWHWLDGPPGLRFTQDSLDAALERYNGAMRSVAVERRLPLLDLAALLPKSLAYLYDDAHFNIRGADTTAAALAQLIASLGADHP